MGVGSGRCCSPARHSCCFPPERGEEMQAWRKLDPAKLLSPHPLQSPNPSQSITLLRVVINGCYSVPEESSSGEKRSRNTDSPRCPCSAWQVWRGWLGNLGLLITKRMGAKAVPGVRECWTTPQAVSLNVKISCFSMKPKYRVAVEVTVAFSSPGFRMKSKSGE